MKVAKRKLSQQDCPLHNDFKKSWGGDFTTSAPLPRNRFCPELTLGVCFYSEKTSIHQLKRQLSAFSILQCNQWCRGTRCCFSAEITMDNSNSLAGPRSWAEGSQLPSAAAIGLQQRWAWGSEKEHSTGDSPGRLNNKLWSYLHLSTQKKEPPQPQGERSVIEKCTYCQIVCISWETKGSKSGGSPGSNMNLLCEQVTAPLVASVPLSAKWGSGMDYRVSKTISILTAWALGFNCQVETMWVGLSSEAKVVPLLCLFIIRKMGQLS